MPSCDRSGQGLNVQSVGRAADAWRRLRDKAADVLERSREVFDEKKATLAAAVQAGRPMGPVARNDMPIPLKATWGVIKAATQAWGDDYASSMGAALAYYTLFSLAPLLLIVIALAGPRVRGPRPRAARS